jgi:hypothetical protein
MMEKELPKPLTLEEVHEELMDALRKSGLKVLELEPDWQELVISFPMNPHVSQISDRK